MEQDFNFDRLAVSKTSTGRPHYGSCNFCTKRDYDFVYEFQRREGGSLKASICQICLTELSDKADLLNQGTNDAECDATQAQPGDRTAATTPPPPKATTVTQERTYGQLSEGYSTYDEFEKEVAKRLKDYVLVKPTSKHIKLCRRLYKKGYTVADTVGLIILNS
jgi:hypothetical protein